MLHMVCVYNYSIEASCKLASMAPTEKLREADVSWSFIGGGKVSQMFKPTIFFSQNTPDKAQISPKVCFWVKDTSCHAAVSDDQDTK